MQQITPNDDQYYVVLKNEDFEQAVTKHVCGKDKVPFGYDSVEDAIWSISLEMNLGMREKIAYQVMTGYGMMVYDSEIDGQLDCQGYA